MNDRNIPNIDEVNEKGRIGDKKGAISKAVRILLLTLGVVSLGFGIIGIFLPVLPTTPFLLLASFCFMKSSDRLHSLLLNHKVLGEYIYLYTKHRAIKKRTRKVALFTLWTTMTISVLIVDMIHAKIVMLVIGALVSIHLFTLKSIENEKDLLDKKFRLNGGDGESST